MRRRLPHSAAALALALGTLATLPTSGEATAPSGSTSPLWAVDIAGQTTGQVGDDDGALAGLRPTLAGLTLEQTRERVNDTEIAYRVIAMEKARDDHELLNARMAVEELRDETTEVAESTVENAITNYRQTNLDQGLLEIEEDLNSALRANALGDAAIIADTETFEDYRTKAKDLQLAEINLRAEVDENDLLSAEVDELQAQLENEQSWLADMEERAIQNRTRQASVSESIWAQLLGTKQGFYLRTCPVAGAHSFIDSWGFPRSGGRRHQGVDILAKIGVPIVSPVDGQVEYRSNSVGGRSFHLFDEKGNYFYGTHLSAYGDVEGEVRAGQIIGYVGDDGNAAGIPHLHFEIHPGGRGNVINPYPDSATVCDGAS